VHRFAGALLLLGSAAVASAQSLPDFQISRAHQAPRIDGVLDDAAWTGPAMVLGEWLSYNPVRGDPTADQRTEVRITYDDRFIYFAFHCFDSEPEKIRTTVSRRDDVFDDDWVGVSLDSTGAGQLAYHLFVNPSGIQMDAVDTASSGERFETDLVWDSAGRRTADGYVVEIALPLQSIRFGESDAVRMGALFFRHVSRRGESYSWPDMPPGQWVFNRHAHLVFDDIKPRRLQELLPSITLPVSQTRATPRDWNGADSKLDAGLSGKYGITSEVTVDGTINPDFSQVESDAFQVQVNQRYPVFFSEKRPFFMEGLGLFNLAGMGDGNMRAAVHTRKIVDPGWGVKVTGTSGPLTFGFLDASDHTPLDIGDRGEAVAGESKIFTVARATYGLKGSDYIGAIVTDTEHAGRHNRVAGGDLVWKPFGSQELSATYLFSRTGLKSEPDAGGVAAQVSYKFDSRRVFAIEQVEHYDTPFQMDTAFYNQTGFTSSFSFVDVSFYPPKENRFGLIRVHPFTLYKRLHDRVQDGDANFVLTGLRFNFSRQGFLDVDHSFSREPWRGREYDSGNDFNTFGNVQLVRWLSVGGYFRTGAAIYYDPVNPFQGASKAGGFSVTWQPTQHFNQSLSYDMVNFDRADTGAHVYTVHIVNSKTVYQFNRHFLIRLIEQFDNSSHRLLTDLLASYEFVPGTVAHAGYGSIYEERQYLNGALVPNSGDYLTVSRGLFFKASYLYRF